MRKIKNTLNLIGMFLFLLFASSVESIVDIALKALGV